MYKLDYSNIKREITFYFILLIAGFILLLTTLPGALNPIFETLTYKSVKSYNIDINSFENNTRYEGKYKYLVDDKSFTCKTNSSSKNENKILKKDKVYYDDAKPSTCVTQYDRYINFLGLFKLVIPLLIVGALGYIYYKKRVKLKKYRRLEKYGDLVKNLKYDIVQSSIAVNNVNLKCIEINYEVVPGVFKKLRSAPKLDFPICDEDHLVDLLIDPTDPTNYYLDFNIELV